MFNKMIGDFADLKMTVIIQTIKHIYVYIHISLKNNM